MADEMRLRVMEAEDIDGVLTVEQASFSEPWTRRDFEETIRLPYALYLVAESGERIVGEIGVRMIAGEGQISNVAVDPGMRGKGLAHTLLAEIIRLAEERGTEEFTLEVRVSNAPAIAVYEDLGFISEGIRKKFYENPVEDAMIMWRRKG